MGEREAAAVEPPQPGPQVCNNEEQVDNWAELAQAIESHICAAATKSKLEL